VIEAAAVACQSDRIAEHDLRVLRSSSTPSALPLRITSASSIPMTRLRTEKDALLHALESAQWNMTKTAEVLSWSRSTLYRQVAKHKIRRYEEHVRSESAD
jgi:transcriptional regulator of acetoin/glycerol metabolism